MENTSMKPLCTYELNYTCWRHFAATENKLFADQMTPVIVMMILFQIVGIPGNVVTLMMYFSRAQKTSANVFIMFLAVIDLFACIVIHPYIVYKLYSFYDQTWTVACKIFEFLIHLNLAMSGLTLLLVAIDRYLAICKPVKFLRFDRNIVRGIVSVTILSIVVSLPLLEFYGPNPNPYEFREGIFVGYRCDFQPQYQGSVFYMAFSTFIMTGFIVEIVVLSVLYKHVAVVAYRSHRAVVPLSNVPAGIQSMHSATLNAGPSTTTSNSTKSQTISKSADVSSSSLTPVVETTIYNQLQGSNVSRPITTKPPTDIFTVQKTSKTMPLPEKPHSPGFECPRDLRRNVGLAWPRSQQVNNSHLKDRLKAAKLLFLVTFVFFMSWMPFFILRVCYTLNTGACRMDSYTGRIFDNLINHVFYVNNAINPILYTILNKTFRTEFALMTKKKCCCKCSLQ